MCSCSNEIERRGHTEERQASALKWHVPASRDLGPRRHRETRPRRASSTHPDPEDIDLISSQAAQPDFVLDLPFDMAGNDDLLDMPPNQLRICLMRARELPVMDVAKA